MKPSELIEQRTRVAIENMNRTRAEYGRQSVDPAKLYACGSRDLSKFTALLVDWREGIERALPTDRKEAK